MPDHRKTAHSSSSQGSSSCSPNQAVSQPPLLYLQAGLEGTGHDLVVRPRAIEQRQVQVEAGQVHCHREEEEGQAPG